MTTTRVASVNTPCEEGVTRRGNFEPCDLPAVAMRYDPEDGAPYPVCKRHVRGEMVPLADLQAEAWGRALARVEALHVRESTDIGPDFCAYCSAKEQEWNSWPCETVAALTKENS